MSVRHHYLQAMGIQVWRSRTSLFDAEPDAQLESCSDGMLDTEEEPSPEVPVSVDVSLPPEGESILSVPATQNNVDEAAQNVDAAQASNPEFRIASIVFPDTCVVVTQVPIQSVTPISSEHLTFLKEVLLSTNMPVADEPEITLFNWPMLRSANFDQSAGAARAASQAFLRGQISKHAARFVLLMGDAPAQYLLSGDDSFVESPFSEKQGRLSGTPEQPQLLTHSVEQVFVDPVLKARIWNDLQPLVIWAQHNK